MDAMLMKLEEVRLSSLDLYREQIVTALGNGKDIVGGLVLIMMLLSRIISIMDTGS